MQVIAIQQIQARPIIDEIAPEDFFLIGDASDAGQVKRVLMSSLTEYLLAAVPVDPVDPPVDPQSIFSAETIPDQLNRESGGGYTIGTKFRALKAGRITHIRFYRSPQETGGQLGRIWSPTGEILTSVNFDAGSGGWQQKALDTPLLIAANITYTVAVNMNSRFVSTSYPEIANFISGDLVAENRGVFGLANVFPTDTEGGANNYFRDVVFEANL